MEAPEKITHLQSCSAQTGHNLTGSLSLILNQAWTPTAKIVHQVIVPNSIPPLWLERLFVFAHRYRPRIPERRYLIAGIRSSRIYIIDVKEPLKAHIHKTIEPEELFSKTGYSRLHTIHCGPEGIYV
jgi:selenium-binding protein 1